jgi:hypothetical protein
MSGHADVEAMSGHADVEAMSGHGGGSRLAVCAVSFAEPSGEGDYSLSPSHNGEREKAPKAVGEERTSAVGSGTDTWASVWM